MTGIRRSGPTRRGLAHLRRLDQRQRATAEPGGGADAPELAAHLGRRGVGWDRDDDDDGSPAEPAPSAPLTARVLALLADPLVATITRDGAATALGAPRPDVEAALDALVRAGELQREGGGYVASPERKAQLEALFHQGAVALGETHALATIEQAQALAELEDDEPRLPVTAGLLSLFLPGTGQLLNGDVGRASLVFAVWSLALLTHLAPIWTFVALYAGAEAFFTAKIRGMERRLALEAAARGRPDPQGL